MRKVVVNSTPLIALCHVGHMDILKAMYECVYVPEAVYCEISAKPESICKNYIDNAIQQGWISVRHIHNKLAKSVFKTQLHDGEVEVMILAKEMDADLIILDDQNARKYAKHLGLTITGTLGVLIKAKQLGYIPVLNPILTQLLEHHIYISEELILNCLEQAGEV